MAQTPMDAAELERVFATSTLTLTVTCPACAGTGINTANFYRTCRECGRQWNDIGDDRSGSDTLFQWEKDPRAKEMMPCGHSWAKMIEQDAGACDSCEGEGTWTRPVALTTFMQVFTKRMASELRAQLTLDNPRNK